MRLRKHLNDNTEIIGPGTDLVISLVAIFLILLVINHLKHTSEIQKLEESLAKYQSDLKPIQDAQIDMIETIAKKIKSNASQKEVGEYIVPISFDGTNDTIRITNDATLQRFYFGEKILFDRGKYLLKPSGKSVLRILAGAIREKKNLIKEIQIQGHASADIEHIRNNYNLDLAADRSAEVFSFFRFKNRIDPNIYVMSASSFGEFMPTERTVEMIDWQGAKLWDANRGSKGSRNRRIEIVLNYR